jgi:hypothetical protein
MYGETFTFVVELCGGCVVVLKVTSPLSAARSSSGLNALRVNDCPGLGDAGIVALAAALALDESVIKC